jgi:DNA-binding response OmpR family regulator
MLEKLIVYVEDNPDDVFFLKRALDQARHKGGFRHIDNIPAARDFLSSLKEPPGLILVDLHIGLESSRDFISHLRTLQTLQKAPIVSLSGSRDEEASDKSQETGANLFMVKPQDLKGWMDMIVKLRESFPPQG